MWKSQYFWGLSATQNKDCKIFALTKYDRACEKSQYFWGLSETQNKDAETAKYFHQQKYDMACEKSEREIHLFSHFKVMLKQADEKKYLWRGTEYAGWQKLQVWQMTR